MSSMELSKMDKRNIAERTLIRLGLTRQQRFQTERNLFDTDDEITQRCEHYMEVLLDWFPTWVWESSFVGWDKAALFILANASSITPEDYKQASLKVLGL